MHLNASPVSSEIRRSSGETAGYSVPEGQLSGIIDYIKRTISGERWEVVEIDIQSKTGERTPYCGTPRHYLMPTEKT